MFQVLGFCYAVCVEKYGVIVFQRSFLLLVAHTFENSYREVRYNIEALYSVSEYKRSVMACVAVLQCPVRQIEHSAEEGYEHVAFIHVRHAVVDGRNYVCRVVFPGGYAAEEAACHGHYHRGRHSLA